MPAFQGKFARQVSVNLLEHFRIFSTKKLCFGDCRNSLQRSLIDSRKKIIAIPSGYKAIRGSKGDCVDAHSAFRGLFRRNEGIGAVIKEDGTILTNLHVVANAPRLIVTFSDGLESPAVLVTAQKDKDLATIKPLFIPDDLEPATLGTSQGSSIGDEVVAIGFPFGYGPSVSAGVISGFNREYKPENSPVLKGLIQFDAAANPGNSGGPLVNMAGEVLGIVTAIMNPGQSKTFAGIGFAVTIESAGAALGIPPF